MNNSSVTQSDSGILFTLTNKVALRIQSCALGELETSHPYYSIQD